MDVQLIPSLEHMMLVNICVALWYQIDIKDFVCRFVTSTSVRERNDKWQAWLKLEENVLKKLSRLKMPKVLKDKVSHCIRPIGLQIGNWLDFLNSQECLSLSISSNIYWTPQGTLNKKKMAEILVREENLSLITRFQIACTYCLEYQISFLWQEIQNYPFVNYTRVSGENITRLVSFWNHLLDGRLHSLYSKMQKYYNDDFITPFEYALYISADEGNEAATKYFLKKFTSERTILVKIAIRVAKRRYYSKPVDIFPNVHHTDLLYYLLSIMDKQQQIEVFKSNLHFVLKCFFDWPWQGFYKNTPCDLWSLLLPEDHYYVISKTTMKIAMGYKDNDYQQLFKIIWQKIPPAYKGEVINLCIDGSKGVNIFCMKNEENIKLILQESIGVLGNEIIFSSKGRKIYKSLLHYKLWALFKFFIQQCALPKVKMIQFKNELRELMKEKNIEVMDICIQIIDELICSYDKRSCEEKDRQAKKLCSVNK